MNLFFLFHSRRYAKDVRYIGVTVSVRAMDRQILKIDQPHILVLFIITRLAFVSKGDLMVFLHQFALPCPGRSL